MRGFEGAPKLVAAAAHFLLQLQLAASHPPSPTPAHFQQLPILCLLFVYNLSAVLIQHCLPRVVLMCKRCNIAIHPFDPSASSSSKLLHTCTHCKQICLLQQQFLCADPKWLCSLQGRKYNGVFNVAKDLFGSVGSGCNGF